MGNKTFIDTFVELQKKLNRAATQLLNDLSEAEDAVQDTFCNLWNKELPETSEEARYKLFAVLRNVCLNKLKKKQRYTQILDNDVILPEEQYEESERIKNCCSVRLHLFKRRYSKWLCQKIWIMRKSQGVWTYP